MLARVVEVPRSFLEMPRWWHAGQAWLAALPSLVETQCRRWQLEVDGAPMHGSNALVVPVRRHGSAMVLRLTPPQDDVAAEVAALRFWNGRGTVQLLDADVAAGSTLLERLDYSRSLNDLPLDEAVPLIAHTMRRLAIPAPTSAPSTTDVAGGRLKTFTAAWEKHSRPFSPIVLEQALGSAAQLAVTNSDLADAPIGVKPS